MKKGMVNITMENFEAYCLDYYENSLGNEEVIALMTFLNNHDEAKSIFENFEAVFLSADQTIHFPEKEQLFKAEITPVGILNQDNYNRFFNQYVNGDLDQKQQKELNLFVEKNPDVVKDFSLYKASLSTADLSVCYPNKEELKRKIIPFYRSKVFMNTLATAAIVIFALLISLPFEFGRKVSIDQLAYSDRNTDVRIDITENDQVVINERKTSFNSVISIPAEIETVTAFRVEALPLMSFQNQEIILAFEKEIINPEVPKRMDLIYAFEFKKLREDLAAREEGEQFQQKSVLGKGVYLLAKSISGRNPQEIGIPQNISLWSLADFSVEQLSYLTNSDMDIHRRKEKEDHIMTFSYVSKNLNLERRRKIRR
ncbi:MAG: hypothetical protein JEZ03_12150 [Bacteroidales bacterium]|nr:hypothetical protein [Bacteroidales bacterium]